MRRADQHLHALGGFRDRGEELRLRHRLGHGGHEGRVGLGEACLGRRHFAGGGQERLHWYRAQVRQDIRRLRVHARRAQNLRMGCLCLGARQRIAPEAAGLQDGAVEQLAGAAIDDQPPDARRTGGLPHHRDAAGIAAEGRDVGGHPAQRLDLVQRAEVVRRQGGMLQVAQRAEAVVHPHHHHAALAGEAGTVVPIERARPAHPGAAMQPHQHRALCCIRRGCPDRQRQAILAHRQGVVAHGRREAGGGLRRDRAVLRGVARAGPGGGGRWFGETQVAHRRLGIGHAAEHRHALVCQPLQGTECGVGNGHVSSGTRRRGNGAPPPAPRPGPPACPATRCGPSRSPSCGLPACAARRGACPRSEWIAPAP